MRDGDDIDIRAATAAQAGAMTALVRELGYPTTAGAFSGRLETWLRDDRCLVAIAQDADLQLLGWIAARRSVSLLSGDHVEIGALIVRQNAQRRGVGRALFDTVRQWCVERRVTAMVVRSDVKRRPAHAFYRRLGFDKVKSQHVYRLTLTKD